MITTKVQVCNMALASIGTRSTIADINENSAEANACNAQYDAALEAMLQAAHWNFARKQIALTLLKDATISPPDNVPVPWLYEYGYPADCVQARYLVPQVQGAPGSVPGGASVPFWTGPPVRFLVSADADADGSNERKVILTNQTQAMLVYTRRVTNVAMWDGSFVVALANYLGALICLGLTGDKGKRDAAFQLANNTAMAARASNGNEGLTVIDPVPDWIQARGYLSDWAYPPGSLVWQAPQNLSMVA